MTVIRLDYCQHCGSINPWSKFRFCSTRCELEDKLDRAASLQRINSFQALADKGTWLEIDNASLRSLNRSARKVILLEKRERRFYGMVIFSYRLTKAGHQLLERWKASMKVSA